MIEQIGIALFGVTAIFLSQDSRISWRRWACIVGLIGQPFWLYATWKAGQWGIFALCFLYAYSWARGLRTYWGKAAFGVGEGGAAEARDAKGFARVRLTGSPKA